MLTLEQFWTIIGLILAIISGTFTWALWVARQIAALRVERVTDHERIVAVESDNKLEREKGSVERKLLSQEFSQGQSKIYAKLDSIFEVTSEIKITCGRHDQRLQFLEKKD